MCIRDRDNTDKDGEPLNEASSSVDFTGEDLDVPGAELDDDNESIGEEDEENNSYSPVSYTHLDVYKRQILRSEAGDFPFIIFGGIQNPVVHTAWPSLPEFYFLGRYPVATPMRGLGNFAMTKTFCIILVGFL